MSRIENVHDVPGIPAIVERLEEANAVGGGVVEQQVAERRDHGEQIKISPANRQPAALPGGTRFSAPDAMHDVNERQHPRRNQRHAHEAVGDSAMMLQICRTALQAPQYVQVGGFGGQHHRQRGQSALAVEAGASHACADQKMSWWIQVVPRAVFVTARELLYAGGAKSSVERAFRPALSEPPTIWGFRDCVTTYPHVD